MPSVLGPFHLRGEQRSRLIVPAELRQQDRLHNPWRISTRQVGIDIAPRPQNRSRLSKLAKKGSA
jgi:hypothetical protein